MNVLIADELLELDVFKCKICLRRLQCPIMQVGTHCYVCAACHEKSAFTNVVRNDEIEKFLSKLYVPCNYQDRGCTHAGTYYRTCKHEKICKFRDKICPFAYLNLCEFVPLNSGDIPAHIKSDHKENILNLASNGRFRVKNPNKENGDVFYLLILNDKELLLRIWADNHSKCFLYAFYYFQADIPWQKASIYFYMRWVNTLFIITTLDARIQHESAIASTHNTNGAFKILFETLIHLNGSEILEISLNIDEDSVNSPARIKDFKQKTPWIKCPECSKCVDIMHYCINCQTGKCAICYQLKPHCLKRECLNTREQNQKEIFQRISLKELGLIYEISCENSRCDKIIKSNDYKHHKDVCLFRKFSCPLEYKEKCNWQGTLKEMANHMSEKHSKFVNQNVYYNDIPDLFFFFKGCDIFKQEYSLTSNGDFTVTTTKFMEPFWDESYRWEVHIKRDDLPMMTVIADLCTEGACKKTINIKNYIGNDKLAFYADIKCIH